MLGNSWTLQETSEPCSNDSAGSSRGVIVTGIVGQGHSSSWSV